METRQRSSYTIISPDQVQPGDLYKFTPTGGAAPIFAQVLAVLQDQNLVQVAPTHGGNVAWTYIQPPVGQVAFGRVIHPPDERRTS